MQRWWLDSSKCWRISTGRHKTKRGNWCVHCVSSKNTFQFGVNFVIFDLFMSLFLVQIMEQETYLQPVLPHDVKAAKVWIQYFLLLNRTLWFSSLIKCHSSVGDAWVMGRKRKKNWPWSFVEVLKRHLSQGELFETTLNNSGLSLSGL